MKTTPLVISTFGVASTAAQSTYFSGLGQVRTFYVRDNHEDLGCLTSAGKWTTNNSLCGNFTANRATPSPNYSVSWTLSTSAGPCGIETVTLKCKPGITPAVFGNWGDPATNGGGPVPGREILRYGAYGVFASSLGNNPPTPQEGPAEIRLYSASDEGKWVWLGFNGF
ncbi:hypothetical protein QBC35DRAFT_444985 [Podospora australis]|uniref:RNase T2-like C-terminal domain-containing protein n=1 Tax=Podospora australis TaxID=1536484 RepID=A0AAN6WI76_9PEZI|nr:hypothetical protein QBC35DRAFT_444985 [Podospora australis]